MIKLLHLSDLHLNSGFANKSSEVREALKDGLMISFEKAIAYAVDSSLDGVVVAGDLFDHDKINFKLEKKVLALFNQCIEAGIHVFYISGNHDPMYTGSFLRVLDESPFFHLYENDSIVHDVIEFDNKETLHVIACGHKSKNEKRDLVSKYPAKMGNDVWLGLAHASVPSAQTVSDKEAYMATALSTIEQLGYDYFALGHIHIRQKLSEKVTYSGNIQGLNYKEVGPKGGYLVSLESGVTHLEALNFNQIQWEQTTFDLHEDIGHLHSLESHLIDHLSQVVSKVPCASSRVIVRVNLSGKTKLYNALQDIENIEELAESIAGRIGLLHLDIKTRDIRQDIDKSIYLEEKTVLSECLKLRSAWQTQNDLLERLLDLPLFTKNMTYSEKINLLEGLMDNLDDDILNRLVKVKVNDED